MEQQVNQVVNFGIGCAKVVSDQYDELTHWLKGSVNDLVTQGEKSKDATAVRIRELAGKATHLFARAEKTQKAIRAA